MKNNNIYVYTSIDSKDYLVGKLCLHTDFEKNEPYYTFKYYASWIKKQIFLSFKLQNAFEKKRI